MPDPSRTQEFLLGQLTTSISNLSGISDKLGGMVQEHGERLASGVQEFASIHSEIKAVGKSVDTLKDEFHQCREENMRRGPCFFDADKNKTSPAMIINVPKIDLGLDWKVVLKACLWIIGVLLTGLGIKTTLGH